VAKRSQFDLQKFRSAVAKLKKQGILKNVDARKAQPFWIRGGKPLKETVAKFDEVVSDKASAVKLTPSKTREYQKAGYETRKIPTGERVVMVPKLATDKVSVTKEGEVKLTSKQKITHIKKAVEYRNLGQWLQKMKENTLRLNAMKRKNEFFGYKVFGHNSYALYRNIGDLIDEIENGSTSGLNLSDKIRETTHKQQNEFFENFEIVRVPRAEAWPSPPERGHGRGWTKKGHREYVKRIRKSKIKGDRLRAYEAERKRRWRAGLTGKAKEKYLRDGRKRSKKARKKHQRKK
jgi:hypothetical protein